MPRMNRLAIGDPIYHVINRANGCVISFNTWNSFVKASLCLVLAK